MALPQQFLDELRNRTALSDLIGRRTRLQRRGREHMGLCPFHKERTPSFHVYDDHYHCFGCGAHGDAIGFVIQTEGLSFIEAVERLAADAGLQVPQQTPQEREHAKREATLHQVMDAACRWYEEQLHGAAGRAALAYLRERGLDDDTIARFRLGFAPDNRAGIKRALIAKDMPEALLIDAGLLIKPDDGVTYDRFRARVMFPITDRRGRVIAFGGRVMPGSDAPAKYLNSPDTPLFDKGRTLFGLATARAAAADKKRVILVEGYMDAIAMARAGFTETVAGLGTALTESNIETLWRLAPEPIVCFDGDEAGARAATRAAERALPHLKPGLSLRFAMLPKGEDPDTFVNKHGVQGVAELLDRARPLADVVWDIETADRRLDTPEARAGLEQRLETLALAIADRKVQLQYRTHFRQRLNRLVWGDGAAGRGNRPKKGLRARETGLGARTGTDILLHRTEQVLIAASINHPAVVETYGEELGSVRLSDPKLDKLRQEILMVYARAPGIDAAALKSHLIEQGWSELLDVILGPEVYVHGGFVRPDAAPEIARTGFVQALARLNDAVHETQLDDAVKAYLADPGNQDTWRRVGRLKLDAERPREALVAEVEEPDAPDPSRGT